MSRHQQSPRKYPRSARVNEVVREALADELERMNDPRLSMVSITGVDVAPDLRQARVYYAALGRSDDEVVKRPRGRSLRSRLGTSGTKRKLQPPG